MVENFLYIFYSVVSNVPLATKRGRAPKRPMENDPSISSEKQSTLKKFKNSPAGQQTGQDLETDGVPSGREKLSKKAKARSQSETSTGKKLRLIFVGF